MSFGFGFGFPRRAAAGGAAPSLNFDFTSLTSLPSRITFSRTSNATLTDSNGRVAYAPHNLLTNSEDFEAAIWQKFSATVTSNTAVAPDGTTTADLLTGTAVSQRLQQTFTAGGAINTYSLYVKAPPSGTFTGCSLLLFNVTTSSVVAQARFSGATFTAPAGGLATSAFVSDGWYRIALTNTSGVTAGNSVVAYIYTDNDTGSGTVGSAVLAWGAQLNVANAPVNLLTFSEQFDNATWDKVNSPTVVANVAVAPDGTTTADSIQAVTGGAFRYVRQTITVAPNATVTASIYVKKETSETVFGGLGLDFQGGTRRIAYVGVDAVTGAANNLVGGSLTATISVVNAGNYWRVNVTATDNGSNTSCSFLYYSNLSNDNVNVSGSPAASSAKVIWGAQLNTGSTALPYVATTSSIYLPPSYNSTTPKNLLGFTQEFDNAAWTKSNSFVQTNLLTFSEQFDNTSAWTTSAANIAANSVASPNGTIDADTLTSNGTLSQHVISAAPSLAATTTYAFSVYAKAASTNFLQITTNLTAGSANHYANFNLQTGVVSAVGSSATATIQDVGNGWYRCTAVMTTVSANATATFILIPVDSGTATRNPSFSTVTSVYIWGAQLVQGSVPGDYQVTTSAAAAVQYSDPNGTRTADKVVATATSGYHGVRQSFAYTVGARYTLSVYARAAEYSNLFIGDLSSATMACAFDLQSGTAGTPRSTPPFTNVVASIQNVGGGWYRCSLTGTSDRSATTTPTFVGYPAGATLDDNGAFYTGDGTSGIFIWGAQLSNSASVDPYAYNPQAAPTSTAYYGPRFDYNPTTLAANGLLIEEQRTNLFLNSDFNTGGAGTGLVTSSTMTGPTGATITAAAFGHDGTTTSFLYKGTVAATTQYAISVFVRMDDGNAPVFGSATSDSPLNDFALVVSGATFSPLTFTIQNFGGGLYRVAGVVTSQATNLGNNGVVKYNTNSNRTFKTSAWQIEAGSFATSYIPTVASQVTRAADNASMLGDNFATWFNASQGTLVVRATSSVPNSDAIVRFAAAVYDTNAYANAIRLERIGTDARDVQTVGGSSSVVTASWTAGNTLTIAGAYQTSNSAASFNGAAAQAIAGSVPTGITTLGIGGNGTNGANSLCGHVRSISYYPTRLPNATLASITA
jgi:hypothetical protein